jgi:phosphatidylglycerol---prolipoprotein diacylglyceryl transferase
MTLSPYSWLMLGSIGLSLGLWTRVARRDRRLPYIYLAALVGAFLGAKLVYLFAEGFLHFGAPDMWLQLATGKSILGGLLGGYAAVELAKHVMGYQRATGDLFAVVTPVGIMLGRVGCWIHGCCQGVACRPAWYTMRDLTGQERWPAVPVEIAFNLLALAAIPVLRKKRVMPGQHFHLYLMAYGVFRFLHEFLREEPRVVMGLTGYQIASLAVLALGLFGFVRRQRSVTVALPSSTPG